MQIQIIARTFVQHIKQVNYIKKKMLRNRNISFYPNNPCRLSNVTLKKPKNDNAQNTKNAKKKFLTVLFTRWDSIAHTTKITFTIGTDNTSIKIIQPSTLISFPLNKIITSTKSIIQDSCEDGMKKAQILGFFTQYRLDMNLLHVQIYSM